MGIGRAWLVLTALLLAVAFTSPLWTAPVLALDPSAGEHMGSSAQESAVNGKLYVSDESGAMTAYGVPGD